ncbi:MAG TPA: biliverdin-producing heme oxygenase [Pirellulaceae bacterium]|jgi:heme oxygenase|nr:biliverdin-producing heme oxygenase [Pirellulaceae bacterium]
MESVEAKRDGAVLSAAETANVLERIRLRTREVHRSLEELSIWEAAFSNREAYKALLEGLLSLVRPADAAIAITLGEGVPAGFSAATRTEWLESDRQSLATSQPPLVADDALIGEIAGSSPFAAAGALYVLEGSALGGLVLSRRLTQAFGIGPSDGGRYFFGHGAETSVRWRRFLAWLDALPLDDAGAEAAASAARSTFERFKERLATLAYD